MEPANSNASETARKVLSWLASLPERSDKRVISGQQLWHGEDAGDGYVHFVEKLHDLTGAWPALIGLDYCKPWVEGITDTDRAVVNALALDWWSAGGLLAFTWLTRNPWMGGEYHNRNNPEWNPQAHDLRELTEPGTALYDTWMEQLDSVADGFTILRDAGAVVLWRPFPEATYDATQGEYGFWWNSPHDPDAYIALWRHMFDYFAVERGLDNLLWVYNAANQDNWRPLDIVYPGDDVVDVVSVDVYADEITIEGDGYSRLLALGKPFYFAETGPAYGQGQAVGNWDTTAILRGIRNRYPQAFGWVTWFSWDDTHQVALADNQNVAELIDDPWVITRDEVDYESGGGTTMADITDDLDATLAQLKAAKADMDAFAATVANIQAQIDAATTSLGDIAARLQTIDAQLDALSLEV